VLALLGQDLLTVLAIFQDLLAVEVVEQEVQEEVDQDETTKRIFFKHLKLI
jgi:uncharacterized membrane protein